MGCYHMLELQACMNRTPYSLIGLVIILYEAYMGYPPANYPPEAVSEFLSERLPP